MLVSGWSEMIDKEEYYYTSFKDIKTQPAPEVIRMIVPEGLRNVLSIDTSIAGRLCTDYFCANEYQVRFRALATKFPGFAFSGYEIIKEVPMVLVS